MKVSKKTLLLTSVLLVGITTCAFSYNKDVFATKSTKSNRIVSTEKVAEEPQVNSNTTVQNQAQQTQDNINNKVQYYFSQDNGQPDKQLIDVINSSKTNLDIAIYSITKKDIVNSIISAKDRGITVRVITDKIESKSKS